MRATTFFTTTWRPRNTSSRQNGLNEARVLRFAIPATVTAKNNYLRYVPCTTS